MKDRRPGEWPVEEPDDEVAMYLRRAAERGRREIVLGSIRAHLEEQPSRASVLATARRWCADIVALANEVAKKLRHPG